MRSTLLEDVEYPMLSSAPRPTLHRVRHCFCNAAALYWPLAAAVAMAVVGYLLPQGAVAYKVAMPCLIGTLFLVLGLCLDRSAWLGGVKALHVHTLMQGYSLVAQPVVYFYAAHQTGLDMTSGLLTTTLATGCVVMMAMPTTAATSLVFVQNANADAAVAALNMPLGQVLGAFTAPLLCSILLSSGHLADSNFGQVMWKNTYQILLPMAGGILLQVLLDSWRPGFRHWLRPKLKVINIGTLCVLFYFIFCKAFSDTESASVLTGPMLLKLLAYVSMVHLIVLLLGWLIAVACRLEPARRIAFVLVATQKTEGLAIAVLTSLAASLPGRPDVAVLSLPVILYHSIQMVVASLLVPFLRLPVEAKLPSQLHTDAAGGAGSTSVHPEFSFPSSPISSTRHVQSTLD